MHGYAYLLDVPEHLESVVQSINGHIERYFPRTLRQADMERYAGPASGEYDPGAQTEVLSRPLWDLLDRGGKHWRPIFAFLTLEALGVSWQPYEQLLSLMVELPHGGSLVIDDIEDNALVRRGQECIHLRYGLDVAINAGNTAYFLPLALLADYPHLSEEQRLALYRVLSRAYVRSHLGQGQDIYWSKYLNVERLNEWMGDSLGPKILELYTQKTASVVEGAAEIVCILARSGAATREACVEFGRALGIAFQIVDDILDFSPARIARGQGGCDLREGKLSYVIFRALQELDGPERETPGRNPVLPGAAPRSRGARPGARPGARLRSAAGLPGRGARAGEAGLEESVPAPPALRAEDRPAGFVEFPAQPGGRRTPCRVHPRKLTALRN